MLNFASRFLALFVIALPAFAQSGFTGMVGAESWSVTDTQARYLPNYLRTYKWQPQYPVARLAYAYADDTLSFAAQVRSDPVNGDHVDRLEFGLHRGVTGVRVGIVPYRISWCRNSDSDSPWIVEVDAFCAFPQLSDLATSAAGVQAYTSGTRGEWLVDVMAGVYKPKIAPPLVPTFGPFGAVGGVEMQDKHGVSINSLNLDTGLQIRTSWVHSDERQNGQNFTVLMHYDTVYAAVERSVAPGVNARLSLTSYYGNTSGAAVLKFDATAATLELIYHADEVNSFAFGISEHKNRVSSDDGTLADLLVSTTSVSYRRELGSGWHTIVQGIHSVDDFDGFSGPSPRVGDAVGVRVAYQF